jgi:hypothetical protein
MTAAVEPIRQFRQQCNFSITVGDHAAHLVGAQEER